jgi:hypothetical protein
LTSFSSQSFFFFLSDKRPNSERGVAPMGGEKTRWKHETLILNVRFVKRTGPRWAGTNKKLEMSKANLRIIT